MYQLLVWEQEKCIQGFGEKIRGEKATFEYLGADGRIILKWSLKK
jgi:hypothetical protein